MRTLRIFISSPGDVAEERDRARQVVESLRRRYAGRFELKTVLWEELPLQADMSFQAGIDLVLSRELGIDAAVFILWSRLGSPPAMRKADGSEYRSGTERELDLMLTARQQSGGTRPALMVYTRQDETSFEERLRGRPTREKEELIKQKKLVEQFIQEEFHDADSGHNVRAYHAFDRPVTFSQRLRTHLTALLDEMAGGLNEATWDIGKQGPPFVGLEAFQPKHADVFLGRDTEILEVRHALREQACNGCAFVMLSGPSGSGKSSLARAGVVPAIMELEIDEQVSRWGLVITTPAELGVDPLHALVRLLAADGVLPELRGAAGDLEDLVAGLRTDPSLTVRLRFKDAVARATQRLRGGLRVLLVLDQLEELFTGTKLTDTTRKELLDAVEALARSGLVWVIATVRSDFSAQVQSQPALARMLEGRGTIFLQPPEADGLRRLIEEPARLAALTFEEREGRSLADRILRDASAHAELLPLVEFALRELFEQRTGQNVLSWDAYDKMGGVEGALSTRAEMVFNTLSGPSQEALGSVLKSLVTTAEQSATTGSQPFVRQLVPMKRITETMGADELVSRFVAERLFTTSNHPDTNEAVVTVAHECLLRVWPRAVAWIERNRDFLHTRARIASRMRDGSPLLGGDPLLESAKAWLARDATGFTEEQRKYVADAVGVAQAAQERAARRRRQVLAGLTALTVISLLGGSIALWQWRVASERKAEAERRYRVSMAMLLTKRAEDDLRSGKVELPIMLAGAAYDLSPSLETRSTLVRVLRRVSPWLQRSIPTGDAGLSALSWNAQSNAVTVGTFAGAVSRWDANTGDLLGQSSFAVGKEGGGAGLKTVKAIHWGDGTAVTTVHQHGVLSYGDEAAASLAGEVALAAVSSGRRWLAVVQEEIAVVRLYDLGAQGRAPVLGSPHNIQVSSPISALTFAPDESQLAIGMEDGSVAAVTLQGGAAAPLRSANGVRVICLAWHARQPWLAVGAAQGQVAVLDTARKEEKVHWKVGDAAVSLLAWHPTKDWLASGHGDSTVRVWHGMEPAHAGTPPVEQQVLRGHEGPVTALSWSPDGLRLASTSEDARIKVWSGELAAGDFHAFKASGQPLQSVAVSSDGLWLAAGSSSGEIEIWSLSSYGLAGRIPGLGARVNSLSWHPTEKVLAAGDENGSLALWTWPSGTGAPVRWSGHGGAIWQVQWLADGKSLVSTSFDHTVRLWSRETGTARELEPHEDLALGLAVTRDGNRIASGANGEVWLRDLKSSTTIKIKAHGGSVGSLSFTPDGAQLASVGNDGGVKTWDGVSGKLQRTVVGQGPRMNAVAFSIDGKLLATGDEKGVLTVMNAADGSVLFSVDLDQEGAGDIATLAWFPGKPVVAAASSDGQVHVLSCDPSAWTSLRRAAAPREFSEEDLERAAIPGGAPGP